MSSGIWLHTEYSSAHTRMFLTFILAVTYTAMFIVNRAVTDLPPVTTYNHDVSSLATHYYT
jgi:hypothetical protein